jgi:hypothetical protein
MKKSLFCLLLLTGCVSAQKLNRVSLNMTKAEVIRQIGSPVSTSAKDNVEYLNYKWREGPYPSLYKYPYFVRLRDGKVDAYGRTGDFDSTKEETLNVNVNK